MLEFVTKFLVYFRGGLTSLNYLKYPEILCELAKFRNTLKHTENLVTSSSM